MPRCFVLIFIIFIMRICLFTGIVHAQKVVDTLKEVDVKSKHNVTGDVKVNEFSPGQKVTSIDTATLQQYRMQSVGDLLAQQVPVFIKSYGFNALSTLSFRGASSAQSQVLWNGVPIQNAALGVADVSTLPVMLMSRVNVVYGGSAALWGSGNVGGALLLESEKPSFESGKHTISLNAATGSFGQYAAGIGAAASGRKWYVSVKAMGQTAANNYAYTDASGKAQDMSNSRLQSGSVLLHAVYKSGDQSTIGLFAWYQDYNREIPPTTYESYSVKKQVDGSLRLLLDWDKKADHGAWYARSSLIRDDIRYDDTEVLLHTVSVAYQYYQEAGWRHRWNKAGQLLVFVPVQLSWMTVPFTHETKHQSRVAVAAAYDIKLLKDKLNIAANVRGETINGSSILLPGADASYTLTHWLLLRANVQRTYRTPTLNELYYYPGGNPSLKPEQGWNEDAGYAVDLTWGRFMLHHDVSVFNRNIQDWIIWLGSAIWTPHNIAEVHSRGTETENKVEYRIDKWTLHAGVNTAYTLATTVKSNIQNDGSIGKQIPYTPRYNGQLNIGFTHGRLYVNYNHTYTGYRFTVTDESEWLEPYNTGNLQLMYNAKLGARPVQLSAQCNNIWNQQYSVVGYRPMPGVNWMAGVRVWL